MRFKKRLLAFSRRLHARIRKTSNMHKIRALLSTEGVYCSRCVYYGKHQSFQATAGFRDYAPNAYSSSNGWSVRSEERFSRNAETDLVCRLLLEKKKRAQAGRSGRGGHGDHPETAGRGGRAV